MYQMGGDVIKRYMTTRPATLFPWANTDLAADRTVRPAYDKVAGRKNSGTWWPVDRIGPTRPPQR